MLPFRFIQLQSSYYHTTPPRTRKADRKSVLEVLYIPLALFTPPTSSPFAPIPHISFSRVLYNLLIFLVPPETAKIPTTDFLVYVSRLMFFASTDYLCSSETSPTRFLVKSGRKRKGGEKPMWSFDHSTDLETSCFQSDGNPPTLNPVSIRL